MINNTDWLAQLCVDATPDLDDCITYLGDDIELLHQLKHTEQDAIWHAEGNVYIHTSMVLQELYALLKAGTLQISGWRRQALILAALLHDIAKPLRTRPFEKGGMQRIGSPQHETYGRSYLAFKLISLPLSFQVIWTVLNLVGEHHTPKRLVIKNAPRQEYWSLARQADVQLLYWLEIADIRGRSCPDPNQQLQYLEEYRLFAEEYQCWESSPNVHSEIAATMADIPSSVQEYVYALAIYQLEHGKIQFAQEALATTYQHRSNYSHLVVVCGPSGSGKSSWIEKHHPQYALVSLDRLREKFNKDRSSQDNKGQIIQHAKEQLRVALREKQNVVWDATNLRADFRSIVCGLGRDYHALVTLVVFLADQETLFRNNKKRQHSVADSVLRRQIDSYQFPLLSQSHQYQIIDSNGDTLYRSGYFQTASDGLSDAYEST